MFRAPIPDTDELDDWWPLVAAGGFGGSPAARSPLTAEFSGGDAEAAQNMHDGASGEL